MIAHDFPLGSSAKALIRLGRMLSEAGYRFITGTPATHARVNARPGNRRARCVEDVFGWSRPFGKDTLPSALVDLMYKAEIIEGDGENYRSLVRLSSLGDLLLFHSAFPTVDADAVFFGPDTYRFASALRQHLRAAATPPRGRVVDIGTGTGAGALFMGANFPGWTVFAGDINERALNLARVNQTLNQIGNVRVCRSNLLDGVDGPVDLIVSNPPYMLDPAGRSYRNGGGTLGQGLSIAVIDAAIDRLAPGGSLFLYTGSAMVDRQDGLLAAAAQRLKQSGLRWTYRELDPDVFGEELESDAYAGVDRIAVIALSAFKPG
ncbi:MAG: SAM-dependent methyltransferase [Rhodospirillales bacterium]|nr:SAM-dependent methyltransferase [Rhodospirillales bacterium]